MMFQELVRLGILKYIGNNEYDVFDETKQATVARLVVADSERAWLENLFVSEGQLFWPHNEPANAGARMFITELLPQIQDYHFPTIRAGRNIDGLFSFVES